MKILNIIKKLNEKISMDENIDICEVVKKFENFIKKVKKRLIIGAGILGSAAVLIITIILTVGFNNAKSNINYSIEQCKEIALEYMPGEIVDVKKDLEFFEGVYEYKFKIRDTSNVIRDVEVNSKFGAISDKDDVVTKKKHS